jgi:hypothetical protein
MSGVLPDPASNSKLRYRLILSFCAEQAAEFIHIGRIENGSERRRIRRVENGETGGKVLVHNDIDYTEKGTVHGGVIEAEAKKKLRRESRNVFAIV